MSKAVFIRKHGAVLCECEVTTEPGIYNTVHGPKTHETSISITADDYGFDLYFPQLRGDSELGFSTLCEMKTALSDALKLIGEYEKTTRAADKGNKEDE